MAQEIMTAIRDLSQEYICPNLEGESAKNMCMDAPVPHGIAVLALTTIAAFGVGFIVKSLCTRKVTQLTIAEFIRINGVDFQDPKTGDTLLIAACKEGNFSNVQVILEHNPDLNLKNQVGDTALDVARQKKHREIAEALLQKGESCE